MNEQPWNRFGEDEGWPDGQNWGGEPSDGSSYLFSAFEDMEHSGNHGYALDLPHEDGQLIKEEPSPAPAMPPAASSYKGLIRDSNHWIVKATERIDQKRLELLNAGAQTDGPTDPASERLWIKNLFDAFLNTSDIVDRPCKNGKAAQATQRLQNGYYDDEALELACWEILMKCRDSQLGVKMVAPHHFTFVEVHESFHDRMTSIVEACQESKALCKSVLDPRFIDRLVDAPISELQRKKTNKVINGQRNVQNAIGRRAVKRGLAIHDLDALSPACQASQGEETDIRGAQHLTPMHAVSASQAHVLPTRTQRKSTSKRKTRASMAEFSSEEDQDEEDEEEPDFTPTKRPRRLRANTATPSKPSTRPASARPRRRRANTATPSKLSTRPASATIPLRPNKPRRQSADRAASQLSSPPAPFNDPGNEAINFREAICDLLNVNRRFAQVYSLLDLRVYARAYNRRFIGHGWMDDRFPGCVGKGYLFYLSNGVTIDHFAQEMEMFLPLAKARGDIFDDAVNDGVLNPSTPNVSGFSTDGNVWLDQALGVVNNPYGLHSQLFTNIG